jgi:hypothetical protein
MSAGRKNGARKTPTTPEGVGRDEILENMQGLVESLILECVKKGENQ